MNAKSVLCSLPPNQQACHQALDWVKNKSVASAWQTCTRPDWMLWALANVPHGKVACPPRWLACCVAEELISLAKRKGIELPDYLGSTIAKVKAWLVRRGRYPGLAKIRAEYFDQHNTLLHRSPLFAYMASARTILPRLILAKGYCAGANACKKSLNSPPIIGR